MRNRDRGAPAAAVLALNEAMGRILKFWAPIELH